MDLGTFIRHKRRELGRSQDDVAKALGYANRSQLSRLERGKLAWKFQDFCQLAFYFGVQPSVLLKELEQTSQFKPKI